VRAIVKTRPAEGYDYRTDVEEADVGPHDIRIEVRAASVCGTDRELVRFSPAAEAFGLRFPVVLGHECAGVVIEKGSEVRQFSLGDSVALESHIACGECVECRRGLAHLCSNLLLLGLHVDGGFAERTVVPAASAFRLPDGVSMEAGALLEPAGVAMHAVQRSTVPIEGAHVLIAGGGPIGLVIAQIVRAGGAASITVIEPNPYRASLARQDGATVIAPGIDLDLGPVDLAFEVSGHPSSLPALIDALRPEGCAVVVGISGTPIALDTSAVLIKKGLTLRGSYGRRLWSTWDALAGAIADGRVDLSRIVTHRVPLERFGEALDLLSADAGKVILTPGVTT
jgi:threonine 3-dehydrogenase